MTKLLVFPQEFPNKNSGSALTHDHTTQQQQTDKELLSGTSPTNLSASEQHVNQVNKVFHVQIILCNTLKVIHLIYTSLHI